MKILLVAPLALLTGCSLLDGLGEDDSTLDVTHTCEVVLQQHQFVDGKDKAKMVESVKINPDCSVNVEFEQEVEPE